VAESGQGRGAGLGPQQSGHIIWWRQLGYLGPDRVGVPLGFQLGSERAPGARTVPAALSLDSFASEYWQ
jgi:hypothetical protein